MSPPAEEEADFVPLGGDDGEVNGDRFGFAAAEAEAADSSIASAPKGPKVQQGSGHFARNAWNDPRNAKDRPKSKQNIPGHEPWILVRTKYGRRFAHNTQTKESLWRIPHDVFQAVRELEQGEREQKEKERNAAWAEEQLKEMQRNSRAEEVNRKADEEEGRKRRRRSESLQREDEEAMMAELAAEAEKKEEQDAKAAVEKVEDKEKPWRGAYDSGDESDYEEVEVTDSEGEEDGEEGQDGNEQQEAHEDGPVEFGEDDIAYQLAAMGEDYGLDEGEYGSPGSQEDWDEGAEGLPISDEDARALFRDMLDDHRISPFTPWEKLITDESQGSILMDDRYTVLSSTRARKEAWESWVKDTAARLKEERSRMEKNDPRIPYLAFLAENATPKLYWPEFKRKFKKDAAMNDRKFSDKDREKIYREHIGRLKLPESTRKADIVNLLKTIPLRDLNRSTTLDTLPQQLLSHTHSISLPTSIRNQIITSHIASLPPPPSGEAEEGELTAEQRVEEEKKRAERQKREDALAERARRVDEDRRKAEKEGRWARRDLRDEERALERAMKVDHSRRNVIDGVGES